MTQYTRTPPLLVDGQLVPITGTITVVQPTPSLLNATVFQGDNPWIVSGSVSVSNFPASQVVTQGTTPWIVSGGSSSPDVNVHDGSGVSISSTGSSLNVDVTNTVPVTGTFFQAIQPVSGTVIANAGSGTFLVDGSAHTQPVSGTVAVTQSTSPWVVSGSITLSNDTNYGTVGANTLRSAAQIGNATGAALFGAGTTTAQVLRVVLPTDQTAIPVTQSGSWTTGRTWTLSAGTDSVAVPGMSADTSPASVNITTVDVGTSTTTGQGGQSIFSGTATAGSSAAFALSTENTVRVWCTGTWVGTLQSEVSTDGGTTWNITGIHLTGTALSAGSFTSNFYGHLNVAGVTNYRIRATAFASGTATIKVVESSNLGSVYIANALKIVDSTTSNQASVSAANALKVENALGNISLASIDTKTPALGQAAQTASSPVVIASGKATYICNTGAITGATATGVKSLAYIWHASTTTKRYQIVRIIINQIAGLGGAHRFELNKITAQNGTPGGTSGTSNPVDGDDAATVASIVIAPTGAPTRLSGLFFGSDVPVQSNGTAMLKPSTHVEALDGKPYVMRASVNEGWEVTQNVTTTITTAPVFNITFEWTEA